MGTKYLITEPSDPSWWVKNKALVYGGAGLLLGLYLAGGCDQDARTEPHPAPRPTSTSSTTPSGSPR
jgi:hypothetical protein